MKKIECIIQNKKLAELVDCLRDIGVRGMTVSEVKGFGNEQIRPDAYLFLPKTKIEIYCSEQEYEGILNAIMKICKTGQLGDGKIAVFDLDELVRIRTGERGEVAV